MEEILKEKQESFEITLKDLEERKNECEKAISEESSKSIKEEFYNDLNKINDEIESVEAKREKLKKDKEDIENSIKIAKEDIEAKKKLLIRKESLETEKKNYLEYLETEKGKKEKEELNSDLEKINKELDEVNIALEEKNDYIKNKNDFIKEILNKYELEYDVDIEKEYEKIKEKELKENAEDTEKDSKDTIEKNSTENEKIEYEKPDEKLTVEKDSNSEIIEEKVPEKAVKKTPIYQRPQNINSEKTNTNTVFQNNSTARTSKTFVGYVDPIIKLDENGVGIEANKEFRETDGTLTYETETFNDKEILYKNTMNKAIKEVLGDKYNVLTAFNLRRKLDPKIIGVLSKLESKIVDMEDLDVKDLKKLTVKKYVEAINDKKLPEGMKIEYDLQSEDKDKVKEMSKYAKYIKGLDGVEIKGELANQNIFSKVITGAKTLITRPFKNIKQRLLNSGRDDSEMIDNMEEFNEGEKVAKELGAENNAKLIWEMENNLKIENANNEIEANAAEASKNDINPERDADVLENDSNEEKTH